MTLANLLYGSKPQIIRTGLVLYLPLHQLDGASFMSKDHYGHLATVTGATWGLQGRTFDNVDDKLVIPDHNALDITQGTLEAWVKTSKTTGNNEIIFKGQLSDGNKDPYLLRHDGGACSARISDGNLTSAQVSSTTNISTLGIFYHLAATWDGSNLRFFVNAKEEGATAYTFTPTTNAINLQIAKGDFGQFNGTIGEIRIYSRALSALEVERNYLATRWRYQ